MTYVDRDFIKTILDECQMEDIISGFVKLEKEGANLKGLSPFVDEKTPSFIVSPAKQLWKCFSSGKGGNNALSFLMENGMGYIEAIEHIAKSLNKDLQYANPKETKNYKEKLDKINDLRPVLKRAIATYQNQFEALPIEHPAKKEVFEHRSYTQEIIDTYQIGYAPGNKFMFNHLKRNDMVKSGEELSLLSGENDFYNMRVTYTIFDANGEPISIAGRELKEPPKIKWLNGKTTTLYVKAFTWYGLHIAKYEARKTNKIYIVEGYNDVIALQTHGILNTVSPCGTNIHEDQITVLKKYANIAVFFMDPDKAGKNSVIKNIPRFIEKGFTCYVVNSEHGDPDDFVRNQWDIIKTYYETEVKKFLTSHSKDERKLVESLKSAIENKDISIWFNAKMQTVDGFKLLLDQLKEKDAVQKSLLTKEICEVISKIKDDSIVIIYQQWLKKESGISITEIKKWIRDFQKIREKIERAEHIGTHEYEFPKGVKVTDQIMEDVKGYQMFQANNSIYTQIGSEPPYRFKSCSNFSVAIIQHMLDEEFPKKLVSVENKVKKSFVFDVPSETFNISATFQRAMTNFGNFRWHGRPDDLLRLQALLFDKMGNGRSLDVLGWQHEGFFLFNNIVIVPDEENIEIDRNGCFKFKDVSYYVPSANVIYKDNLYKYMPQKNFRHIPGNISSVDYFGRIYRVHGNHAISAIFHAIACMFHDIVVKCLKGFPINFLYGPPGTGKDELNHAVKSLWGIPQVATNLEGKNATKTATIRELAQFTNALMEWSEYSRGDQELDGTIKSIWDLRGKKIGQKESRIATDNIPVLSGVSLTGNEYPDNSAIITRIIWNDMDRIEFTEEDEDAFNKLNDIIDEGVTHITVNIIKQRKLVEKNFNKEYRLLMDVYQRRIPGSNKRMLKNISTLTAFYNILKDVIPFPFDYNQIIDHFTKITEAQMRKLTSSSIVTRWWDCFVASMRGTLEDKIMINRDLRIEGNLLYFQFTNCFNKVQRQWFSQYRDGAPNKTTMKEAIEKDSSYFEFKSTYSFNTGADRRQSSAMAVDILKLPEDLRTLIKSEISRQEFELNNVSYSLAPSVDSIDKKQGENQGIQEDLPF